MKEIMCPDCLGIGEHVVDSGGITPWGAAIDIGRPCENCGGERYVFLDEKQEEAFVAWRTAINCNRAALRELTDRAVAENHELRAYRAAWRELAEIAEELKPNGRWIPPGAGREINNLSQVMEIFSRADKALKTMIERDDTARTEESCNQNG